MNFLAKCRPLVPVCFASLALSFVPTSRFFGLTGLHWVFGYPFMVGVVKFGTMSENDAEHLHIDVNYEAVILDAFIWMVILQLCVWLAVKVIKR